MAEVTREEFAALRAEVAALKARLGEAAEKESGEEKAAPVVSPARGTREESDTFLNALGNRIRTEIDQKGSPFGLGIINGISQVRVTGSVSSAFSIVTVRQADDLPTGEQIDQRRARVEALVADPLTLRILRALLALPFGGKPMKATTAELSASLLETPERIEAALRPLVDTNQLERGLLADNTVFYQWDGNNHAAMAILFRAW